MAQYELNLQDYLRIIRKRAFVIIASIIIFAVSSYFYISSQVPEYSAKTTVKVDIKKTAAPFNPDWAVYSENNNMETQAKVIKGFSVLRNAAKKLAYIDAKTNESEIYDIISTLSGSVSAQPIENTNLIEITATGAQPAEAVNIANMVAQAYLEENLKEKNKEASTSHTFIEEQLSEMRKRLAAAENKLKKIGSSSGDTSMTNETQKKLTAMEFELQTLREKYTEKHPKVITLIERINTTKKTIKNLSHKDIEFEQLMREIEVNRKIYAMLRERLEEVRISEAEKVSDVSIINPATLSDTGNTTQSKLSIPLGMFLGLVMGLILSIVIENLDTSISTIEDVENIVKLNVLGIIPSIYTELPPEQNWLKRLKRHLLGRWKNDEEMENYSRLLVFYKPNSPISESFRNIRTTLMFKSTPKTVMITSSNPREGKTSLITNIGLTMSQEGQKTLLVAADLRRPSISKAFGIEATPGLSEILTGTATLDESVKGISDMMLGNLQIDMLVKSAAMKNIYILPSGKIPSYPAELLNSPAMAELIEEMKSKFDIVLFDAPPVLVVTDASILAPRMDKIVMVYEIGKTSRHALARAKTQLESVDGKIAGVVLNHINPHTEIFKAYPYYYQKYQYGRTENT